MSLQNFNSKDPFKEAADGDKNASQDQLIHIRIQQRSGRKTLTTVQGISDCYDKKRLVKTFKKIFSCNGTVVDHDEYGEVLQLQGDQRQNIADFLIQINLGDPDQIKVHGF